MNRRETLSRIVNIGAAAFAANLLPDIAAAQGKETQKSYNPEQTIISEFKRYGIDITKPLSQKNLLALTSLKQPVIFSPLSVYNAEKRARPKTSVSEGFRNKLISFEHRLVESRFSQASLLIKTLPQDGTVEPSAWKNYLNAQAHLLVIEHSLDLLRRFYAPTTDAERSLLQKKLAEVEDAVTGLRSLKGFEHVKTGTWLQESSESFAPRIGGKGKRYEFREVKDITLNEEQKKYRDLIISMVSLHPSPHVRSGIETLLWIAYWESGLNPNTANPAANGGRGMFQFVSSTWVMTEKLKGLVPGTFPYDQWKFDAQKNIEFALDLYDARGTQDWSESEENWGPYVEKKIKFPRD